MHQSTIDELQQQIQGSPEQRFGHKMHAVRFRKLGMTYPELSRWFGESPRTIKRWVRSYNLHGIDGLLEKHSGRPTELTALQRAEVLAATTAGPQSVGLPFKNWTGRALAKWIIQRWGVRLRERQCRRMIETAKSGGSIQ
ncbi:MAG TPA: helix-turn-helix domain-containing protein [Bryobacteraceae bacterium]|nr:helix-turn-helix domain-containing protein [Bryobacteraceae bacterium]